jgi:hypothetical protein
MNLNLDQTKRLLEQACEKGNVNEVKELLEKYPQLLNEVRTPSECFQCDLFFSIFHLESRDIWCHVRSYNRSFEEPFFFGGISVVFI